MVLVEEYFELNESDNVSKAWKTFQIILYALAAILGIWSGFTLELTRLAFEEKCHLFGKVVVDKVEGPPTTVQPNVSERFIDWKRETLYSFDPTTSEWGSDSLCQFCEYSMISSFIFATIWGTFFLMCGHGGKASHGLPQPWRIVIPALIFNAIFTAIAFSSADYITDGNNYFCHEFDKEKLKVLSLANDSSIACKYLDTFVPTNASVLMYMTMAQNTSWACAVFWLLAFMLLLIRVIVGADFELYKVAVHKGPGSSLWLNEVDNVVVDGQGPSNLDKGNTTFYLQPSTSKKHTE